MVINGIVMECQALAVWQPPNMEANSGRAMKSYVYFLFWGGKNEKQHVMATASKG